MVVLINKIDRPEARPEEVIDEILELLMDLDASDAQLDCPFLFASAREVTQSDLKIQPRTWAHYSGDHRYHPAPEGDPDADTRY